MLKLKYFIKKNRNLIIIPSMTAIVILFAIQSSGLNRIISDFLCTLGLLYIVIGSARYIKNVGLFKTFAYHSYKRKWKKSNDLTNDLRPMTLAEYTQDIVMNDVNHSPVAPVLLLGIILCVISTIPAIL